MRDLDDDRAALQVAAVLVAVVPGVPPGDWPAAGRRYADDAGGDTVTAERVITGIFAALLWAVIVAGVAWAIANLT